jgi:hypothetical protein
VFCGRCTASRLPLLRLGYIEPVRVCDGCFVRLSQEDGNDDASASLSLQEAARSDSNALAAEDDEDFSGVIDALSLSAVAALLANS